VGRSAIWMTFGTEPTRMDVLRAGSAGKDKAVATPDATSIGSALASMLPWFKISKAVVLVEWTETEPKLRDYKTQFPNLRRTKTTSTADLPLVDFEVVHLQYTKFCSCCSFAACHWIKSSFRRISACRCWSWPSGDVTFVKLRRRLFAVHLLPVDIPLDV
jgi:hypothetical protein